MNLYKDYRLYESARNTSAQETPLKDKGTNLEIVEITIDSYMVTLYSCQRIIYNYKRNTLINSFDM
jgi:hypothetical protein